MEMAAAPPGPMSASPLLAAACEDGFVRLWDIRGDGLVGECDVGGGRSSIFCV